ncbi:MAG: sugar ABC transporter permease [Sphaerochaetaceae bacterium]|nr:sugar ABC transporter permease [Sphaerochaetaceae bacterium]
MYYSAGIDMMRKGVVAMTNKDIRKTGWILLFITPGLVVVFTFILLPLFMSLFNSLFDWKQLLRGDFVGLGNFKDLFTQFPYKERFYNALGNNTIWFFLSMFLQNSLALFFGYLLSREIIGSNIFKRIFFLPVMFSIIAVGFLWGLYLRPNGLLNGFLQLLKLDNFRHAWLGEEKLATTVIVMVNIWRWIGFPILAFMSAIDNVPQEMIEAAHLDGVNDWGMFWKIVFPMIIPTFSVITVLTIIHSLNVFELVFTMAGLDGGPNYSTDTIGTLFYRTAFGSVDAGAPEIGMGSAIAVMIYIMTFTLSLISIIVTKKKEVEV